MDRKIVRALAAAGALWVGHAVARADIAATLSMPYDNALVRADVPVFGVATAERFKEYRVEYGLGPAPAAWHLIARSSRPQPTDPWATGKAKWNPNIGVKGNLAVWHTGLTSYTYGTQKENLNGLYTLRLTVEDQDGQTAEARVLVNVARAVTMDSGGIVESRDERVYLKIPRHALDVPFALAAITPVGEHNPALIDFAPADGLARMGAVYEFRPPGLRTVKPGVIRFACEDAELEAMASSVGHAVSRDQVGIYAYDAVNERWRRVPGSRGSGTGDIIADFRQAPEYVAYYALMLDTAPPPRPRLTSTVTNTCDATMRVGGSAEAHSQITLLLNNEPSATTQADEQGLWQCDLPLAPGQHVLSAFCCDEAGNRSASTDPLTVERRHCPPTGEVTVSILGPVSPAHGDVALVKLQGTDADPSINTAMVRVWSESDPDGLQLSLKETGPRTGVFVGRFALGAVTTPADGTLAARAHGERVTVQSVDTPGARCTVPYADRIPPSCPAVRECVPTSAALNTFETPGTPTGGWQTVGGLLGAQQAVVDRQRDDRGGRVLRLSKGYARSHMGVSAWQGEIDVGEYPVISFDYRLMPDMHMEMVLTHGGKPYMFDLNDREILRHNTFGAPREFARIPGICADGQWRHAELDLMDALRSHQVAPGRLSDVEFSNWDMTAYKRRECGPTGRVGSFWEIDNFRIGRWGSNTIGLAWRSTDDAGIGGYSYCVDREAVALPPESTFTAATNHTVTGLADGRWFAHVRARDTHGNWGGVTHYPLFVDTEPPQVVFGFEHGATRDGLAPFTLEFEDAGAGVQPSSLEVELNGYVLRAGDPGLTFDVDQGRATVAPRETTPCALLFADGEKVLVHVAVGDSAGHSATPSATFVAESPLACTPANPDGAGGWYVTPPSFEYVGQPDATVRYAWDVRVQDDEWFAQGKSINRLYVDVRRDGIHKRYMKPIKLDRAAPIVTGVYDRVEGVVRLSARDRALVPGRLWCTVYRRADGGEAQSTAHEWLTEGTTLRGVEPDLAPQGRERVRWHGWFRVPASGVAHVGMGLTQGDAGLLRIDGEEVWSSGGAEAGCDVLLSEGLHALALDVTGRPHVHRVAPLTVRWPDCDEPESLDGWAIRAAVDEAEIHYRLDDGEERIYRGPVSVPAGARRLAFYGVDAAGHVSPTQTIELVAAEVAAVTRQETQGVQTMGAGD